MEPLALFGTLVSAVPDILRGAGVALATVVVVVTALVIVGFVILFRRRGDRTLRDSPQSGIAQLRTRAGSMLVRLDDGVRDSENELGFAVAQFGEQETRGFASALATAKGKLAEAFRLKHSLDDAYEDTDRQEREWTLQIIALCEQAEALLAEQSRAFGQLRQREVGAAATLRDIRERSAAGAARLETARALLARLDKKYVAAATAMIQGSLDEAEKLLAGANRVADSAEPGISGSGVSAVSSALRSAVQSAHRAHQLIDDVEALEQRLNSADEALARLVSETRVDLDEARAERDKAPDAETGERIIDAISETEEVLAGVTTPGAADPIGGLERLAAAVAQLDAALASARNQQQRLHHARIALAGTLISARSQIGATRDLIGSRGGGVDARTRLAEAERQLMLAEAEADPVEALDTARRAVTHARDADALARFATMRSR